MKFHWGHGLLVFFIVFIGILVFVVFKSTTISRDLVRDDYYSLDINYQDRYDRIENRKKLERDLIFRYNSSESCLLIDFGSSKLPVTFQGRMFRVAGGKSEDLKFADESPGSKVCIPVEQAVGGKWVVELNWEDGESRYFKEERILITGK